MTTTPTLQAPQGRSPGPRPSDTMVLKVRVWYDMEEEAPCMQGVLGAQETVGSHTCHHSRAGEPGHLQPTRLFCLPAPPGAPTRHTPSRDTPWESSLTRCPQPSPLLLPCVPSLTYHFAAAPMERQVTCSHLNLGLAM
jgi:hypothetical protein